MIKKIIIKGNEDERDREREEGGGPPQWQRLLAEPLRIRPWGLSQEASAMKSERKRVREKVTG